MELNNIFKSNYVFRFKNKKKVIEAKSDEFSYIAEVKLINNPKCTENLEFIAEIPLDLGKSDKISNKSYIISALRGIKSVSDSTTDSNSRSKSSARIQGEQYIIPTSINHHFFNRIFTPYTPGVVRIKGKKTRNPEPHSAYREIKTRAKLTEDSRDFMTPQPGRYYNPDSSSITRSSNVKTPTKIYPISPVKLQEPRSLLISTTTKDFKNSGFKKAISYSKSPLRHEEITEKKISNTPSFTGNQIMGLKEGFGKATFANGDWYKGAWKKNLKEGPGKYYYANYKVKYIGEFKNDLRWGPGILKFDAGDVFKGNWTNGIIDDGITNIKYKDNSEYDGEIVNGRRCGQGKIEYSNGCVFQGTWKNDQRSGVGSIVHNLEFFFEGYFSGDYTDGSGVLVVRDVFRRNRNKKKQSDSSTLFEINEQVINKKNYFEKIPAFTQFSLLPVKGFDLVFMTLSSDFLSSKLSSRLNSGKFISGKLSGGGLAKYGEFALYHGNFVNGKKSGYGRMKYTDPEHQCEWLPETEGEYMGEWFEDKRHGTGVMVWPNGIMYEGRYNNDRRHNVIGKLTFQNGDIYEGGWIKDLMEGCCTILKKDMVIKGQFLKGELGCRARIEFSDRRVYEGEIFNITPHGMGKMRWPDGNVYEGGFNDGYMDGMGRMFYTNGDIYEGTWENGSQTGKGTMIYFSSKNRYQGEWVDGKRYGEGVLKNSKGKVLKSGFWVNNEPID